MHLCCKLWSDEPLYEYLKLFLEARVLKHHQRHTFFILFFCKTSLTNKEIAKRNRINFTGGVLQPRPPPSEAYIDAHLSWSVLFYQENSASQKRRSINAQKNTPRDDMPNNPRLIFYSKVISGHWGWSAFREGRWGGAPTLPSPVPELQAWLWWSPYCPIGGQKKQGPAGSRLAVTWFSYLRQVTQPLCVSSLPSPPGNGTNSDYSTVEFWKYRRESA